MTSRLPWPWRCKVSRRRMESLSSFVRFLVAATGFVVGHAHAQVISSLSVAEQHPFVISVVPVVRNGAVGGVAVDAKGAIEVAEQGDVATLRTARRAAKEGLAGDIT